MKKDHSVRFCNIRKYYVPKGVMGWIPKNSEVPRDKVNIKGPTFVRGPNLVAWFHGFAGLLIDQGVLSHKIKLIKELSGLPNTVLYKLSHLESQEKLLDHGQ